MLLLAYVHKTAKDMDTHAFIQMARNLRGTKVCAATRKGTGSVAPQNICR